MQACRQAQLLALAYQVLPGIDMYAHASPNTCLHLPDLLALQDEHDASLFEHYGTSEVVTIDVVSGERKTIGPPRVYIE